MIYIFLVVKVRSLSRLMQSINEWKAEFNLHLGVKLLRLILSPIKRERFNQYLFHVDKFKRCVWNKISREERYSGNNLTRKGGGGSMFGDVISLDSRVSIAGIHFFYQSDVNFLIYVDFVNFGAKFSNSFSSIWWDTFLYQVDVNLQLNIDLA